MLLKVLKVILYLLAGFVALLVATVFVLWLLYGDSTRPVAPPGVVEGTGRLGVVTLDPLGLTIKDVDRSWIICQGFELRVSEEGGVKSLLIRGTFIKNFTKRPDGSLVHSDSEELLYSDAAYAVALDGSFARRVVSEDEWGRARRFARGELDSEYSMSGRRFSFREGETLPKGGATKGGLPLTKLPVAGAETEGWLFSQGGAYVAGFSHTSRRRPFKRPSLIPFSGEDDRILDGTMYVDIFDGATGERLARASAGHRGSYDMYVFQQATWFDGRYFAMPLDHAFGVWLVGVIPG